MNKPWSQPVCCHNLKVGTAVWEIHHQLYGTAQNQAISNPVGKYGLLRNKISFCSVLASYIRHYLHCFIHGEYVVNALA